MTYAVYARFARDEAEAYKREVCSEILKVAGIQAPMSAFVPDSLTIKYVEETVIYDKSYKIIMCLMRDITDEETSRVKKENVSRQTIEITDKVIEKQMRVVQEIASLLGETTAETKIALTNLKESLKDE